MDKLHIIPRCLSSDSEDRSSESARSFSKRYLVNKLNYINFQDRTILVNLKHNKYATITSLQATTLPCAGDRLDCVWAEIPGPGILGSHTFHNLFITDGKKCLLVNPEVISINEHGISLLLPETCSELNGRKMKRYPITGIQVLINQNSAILKGSLLDYSSISFCTRVTTTSPQVFQWINFAASVTLHLYANHELLYSGECMIIRQSLEQTTGILVLSAINDRFQRYKPKQFRSTRYKLLPSPNMVFVHPLTGKSVNLKTIDLSGSGFSVEENAGSSLLFAGLTLPKLELNFAGSFRITCRAQVVYRNTSSNGEKDGVVKCGLAILDMDMVDQIKLLSLLHQTDNRNSYINTSVDMDTLWSFFFETGFIYPEKYAFFQTNKSEVKRLYEQLYNHNPGIARHFIHQEQGAILGHMSMVRCYDNSWLIHHHAASKIESMKAGIMVLKQISCYANDLHHLQSAHLNYVFCYYRPDNKFPNRIFGGFSRELDDPGGCSLDKFAYFHYRQKKFNQGPLYEPWTLTEVRSEDFAELKRFYRHVSGGLMIDAFDLQSGIIPQDGLAKEYQRLGFKKEKRLYSLLEEGQLKALILANITDIGLNMANLTNCATVIVIDDSIPRYYIESALSQVAGEYEHQEMPVLIYPVSYAEKESLPCEKNYTLWIMNLEYLDQYFKFCDSFFSSIKKTS
jgi:hypothetical protein